MKILTLSKRILFRYNKPFVQKILIALGILIFDFLIIVLIKICTLSCIVRINKY
jgi:hypothetical protein